MSGESRAALLEGAPQAELRPAMEAYYARYYRDQLGLQDWPRRVAARLEEEAVFGDRMITMIEQWLNYDFRDKRVLVVGSGTGAELLTLHQRSAEVWGIDPNPEACAICETKAALAGLPRERIKAGVAEAIPFDTETFDFVYCYTVLEHVGNVDASIREMIRVCRPGGRIFIETPDYRVPYEEHYKLFLPTFLPRIMQKWFLKLRGRPTAFFDSLQLVTAPRLLHIFQESPVITFRVYHDHRKNFAREKPLQWFLNAKLGIIRNQRYFLYRLPERRS